MAQSATFGGYVKMDPAAVRTLMRSPAGPVMRDLLIKAELVKTEARRLVGVSKPDPIPRRKPRHPGELRDSIVKRFAYVDGRPSIIVGSDKPYAVFHHEGTYAHEIRAVNAPLLVFWWGKVGKVMRIPKVNHPGTRPNRFLLDAMRVLRGL